MVKYIIKRLMLLIPIAFCTAALVFFMMALAPGDPVSTMLGTSAKPEAVEAKRIELGLDKPVIVQFVSYMKGLLKGDLGISYTSKRPVFNEFISRFPATLKLSFYAMIVVIIIAIPIGIISAIRQYSLFDNMGMIVALTGISMPNFWLGLLLILLFALKLGWLPSGGSSGTGSVILPAITLGATMAANLTRTTRSTMLEVIRQDYIRTARAKGVGYKKSITVHALRNAVIPIITVMSTEFASMLAGACVVETVFSWPGIGRLTIDAINRKDRPLAIGSLIMTAIVISMVYTVLDILYAAVDPRIRAGMGGKKNA